jgi:hypothetical protein
MYLITHPRRMFRKGDRVLHVGQGNTYRGHVGTVTHVQGSKLTGKVFVKWPDHVALAAQEYSAAWSRENLLVNVCQLATDLHDFGGKAYVRKYSDYAIHPAQADVFVGRITPHALMKEQVERRDSKETFMTMAHRHVNLEALLGTPVRIDVLKPVLDPGQYTAKLHVPNKPEAGAKVWTFPVLVRKKGDAGLITINAANEWELLQDGEYEIFNKVSEVTIKPIAKKEIVFTAV